MGEWWFYKCSCGAKSTDPSSQRADSIKGGRYALRSLLLAYPILSDLLAVDGQMPSELFDYAPWRIPPHSFNNPPKSLFGLEYTQAYGFWTWIAEHLDEGHKIAIVSDEGREDVELVRDFSFVLARYDRVLLENERLKEQLAAMTAKYAERT